MATPAWVNAGSISTAAAGVVVAPPSGVAVDDIAYIGIETDGGDPAPTLTGGTGFGTWLKIVDVVQGGTRCTVYRAVITSATPTGPSIVDTGNHQAARMIAIRGADTTVPEETPSTGTDSTSDTSGTMPAHTTSGDERLVLLFAVGDLPDATGTAEYTWNSFGNLTNGQERTDNSVASGTGGSLSWATGELATAGSIGTITYTKANAAVKAHAVIAVKAPSSTPAVGPPTFGPPISRSERALLRR